MKEELLKGVSLKENIASVIAKDIHTGTLKPGQKINEENIASRFSVSRTPVREVLATLTAQGVLEKIPNRGFFVKESDHERLDETYEMISILDFSCAKRALPYMTDADYMKMEELIAKMDIAIKFENFPEYFDFQGAFHNVYIAKCQNSVLIDNLAGFLKLPIPISYSGTEYEGHVYENLMKANDEHRAILETMKSGDMDRLEVIIYEHWGVYGLVKVIGG